MLDCLGIEICWKKFSRFYYIHVCMFLDVFITGALETFSRNINALDVACHMYVGNYLTNMGFVAGIFG